MLSMGVRFGSNANRSTTAAYTWPGRRWAHHLHAVGHAVEGSHQPNGLRSAMRHTRSSEEVDGPGSRFVLTSRRVYST